MNSSFLFLCLSFLLFSPSFLFPSRFAHGSVVSILFSTRGVSLIQLASRENGRWTRRREPRWRLQSDHAFQGPGAARSRQVRKSPGQSKGCRPVLSESSLSSICSRSRHPRPMDALMHPCVQ
ncbi:hypothetical protein V8C34DRAFT_7202 [Trichoderma compactum]